MDTGIGERARGDDRTERERNRAKLAADVAEFLKRGGVIEDLTRQPAHLRSFASRSSVGPGAFYWHGDSSPRQIGPLSQAGARTDKSRIRRSCQGTISPQLPLPVR